MGHLKVEQIAPIAIVSFNRPQVKNALSLATLKELVAELEKLDQNEQIGAIILTGGDKIFAAGGDVEEMEQIEDFAEVYKSNYLTGIWERITAVRKPLIAAVAGFALGGGCEIAMMCDIIIATESAKFGQPEVKLGTMPGGGGTQRLVRAIGKAKAMEMCLTGRTMGAEEAERAGLVARVVPGDELMSVAKELALQIAGYSKPVVAMIKEAINYAADAPLAQGLQYERRLFHSTFALRDRREGMSAFKERRKPNFGDS